MIWLASYPRSGNTFFRIVLDEVYGIESSSFSAIDPQATTKDYQNYQVVKTHVLPEYLAPADPDIPAVYLVRDGRDALVSMAWHRTNMVAPGTSFKDNLLRAIQAKNSHFGGWSRHVEHWQRRASIVIRFEDLIQDPLQCVESIRPLLQLPPPRKDKLPTFADLKSSDFEFRSSQIIGWATPEIRQKFFRKGKVGAWTEEMPRWMQWLFYYHHGRALRQLGYENRGWLGLAFGKAA